MLVTIFILSTIGTSQFEKTSIQLEKTFLVELTNLRGTKEDLKIAEERLEKARLESDISEFDFLQEERAKETQGNSGKIESRDVTGINMTANTCENKKMANSVTYLNPVFCGNTVNELEETRMKAFEDYIKASDKDQIKIHATDRTRTLPLPSVFSTNIQPVFVQETFRRVNMDSRQPYAVSPLAGKQHSAEGWGTGRAVARVPRVKGSGTRRAGQGAFANFCRKGRLAHPTKTTRKWHRKVSQKEKMQAIKMGIAATGNASLVEARGHKITNLETIPFVVGNEIYKISKTGDASDLLEGFGLEQEISKVVKSTRAGIGKMRNRKYRSKKGILLIHCGEELKAFRNIQGLEMMNIEQPDLLKLCPGGTLGRFVIWTEDAFEKVDKVFENVKVNKMISQDLTELFYKPEVQALLEVTPYQEKIRNGDIKFMTKLNPYLELSVGMSN